MAGYSGAPLVKKLGLKDGFRCYALHAPDGYARLLGKLPPGARFESRLGTDLNFVHGFFADAKSLRAAFGKLKASIRPEGMLWISWRKGKVSDISENDVRELALAAGLVDVKVCAIDETWSGLKLVYRLKDRPLAK